MKLDHSTRVFHYDIARGAYLKPEYFRQAIKLAADAGFTHFLPYLEHMQLLKSASKQSPDCAYSIGQMQSFAAYASSLGIELIPHFNVLGHSRALIESYPTLGAEKVFELDITKPETVVFLRNCLREMLPLCSCGSILIGGDEWQLPAPLARRKDFNAARAIADYLNVLIDFLQANGVKPLLWHDMLLHYPEVLKWLSRNAVIVFWIYDEDSDYPLLQYLKEHGFSPIIAGGLCDGYLTNRRTRGIKKCLEVAANNNIPIMMTCWEIVPWERMRHVIPLLGSILRNESRYEAVIKNISIQELCHGFNETPGVKSIFESRVNKDLFRMEFDAESFTRYHYPAGPIYQSLNAKPLPPPATSAYPPPAIAKCGNGLALQIDRDMELGEVLAVFNNNESFKVYPKFGMTLQAWHKDGKWLIFNLIEKNIKAIYPYPGGYRSYLSAGGLRPVASFGAWHNPCMIWNYPFAYEIEQNTKEAIIIRGRLELYHLQVQCLISVHRGAPGFQYRIVVKNRLDHAAFFRLGFNFMLAMHAEDMASAEFYGKKFSDQSDSLIFMASNEIEISCGGRQLTIETDDAMAGIWMDWGQSFLTPDFRTPYLKLNPDAQMTANWQMKAELLG